MIRHCTQTVLLIVEDWYMVDSKWYVIVRKLYCWSLKTDTWWIPNDTSLYANCTVDRWRLIHGGFQMIRHCTQTVLLIVAVRLQYRALMVVCSTSQHSTIRRSLESDSVTGRAFHQPTKYCESLWHRNYARRGLELSADHFHLGYWVAVDQRRTRGSSNSSSSGSAGWKRWQLCGCQQQYSGSGGQRKCACVMSLSVKLKTRETQSIQSVRQALFGDRVDGVTVQPTFLASRSASCLKTDNRTAVDDSPPLPKTKQNKQQQQQKLSVSSDPQRNVANSETHKPTYLFETTRETHDLWQSLKQFDSAPTNQLTNQSATHPPDSVPTH